MTTRPHVLGQQILEQAFPQGADLPVGPTSSLVPALYKFTDALVQISVDAVEAQEQMVACLKGCASCCRHLVPMAPAEAYALANYIGSVPEPRQAILRRRFAAALEKGREIASEILSNRITQEQADRLGHRYIAQKIDCPFLEEDETCGEYEHRPMVCREYMVTSAPSHCFKPGLEGVERVPLPASAAHTLIETNGHGTWIPMIAALEWAKQNPEPAEEKPGEQWIAPFLETFDQFGVERTLEHFTLRFGEVGIDYEMDVHTQPVPLPDMLPAFRKITDSLVQIAVNASAEVGQPISCKPGCGGCCRMAVPISEAEAWRIRAVVDDMPEPRRSHVQSRFAAATGALRPLGVLEELFQAKGSEDQQRRQYKQLEQYQAAGVACPFLEDENCSIYEERPLICRQFVVHSDPKNCSRIDGQGVKRISILARPSDALIVLDTPGERIAALPLVSALEWTDAQVDRELPRKTGHEWLRNFSEILQFRTSNALMPKVDAREVLAAAYPEGPAAMVREVPSGEVGARGLLPVLRKFTNALVQISAHRAEVAGGTISCTKGCGACCRQVVPLATPEVYELADLVDSMPEPKQSEVRRKFAEGLAKTRKEVDELLASKKMADKQAAASGLKYFEHRVPCPFLEEESCSIHPNRPLVCREFLVTSPAANCSNPSPETIRRIPLTASPARALMLAAPGDRAGQTPWVPMIAALEWAAAHPEKRDAKPGTKWLNEVIGEYQALANEAYAKARK